MVTERQSTSASHARGTNLITRLMRQTFYLLLTVLILRMFFPDLAQKIEVAASAFLDLASALLTSATAHAATGGRLF